MRVCFVSEGGLDACVGEEADIILFGFNVAKEVRYEKELAGESRFFEDAALLSKKSKSVVVCGCVTDTRGHKRKSAIVAENGKLLGVSDMTHVVDGEVGSGVGLRVYETRVGKMGVAVAEDIRFPSVIKSLAVCGSDFIVCPYENAEAIHAVLIRAHAYCYGVPVLFCGRGRCMIAAANGDLAFASPESRQSVDFQIEKEYHLVETRRRFTLHGN